MKRLILVLFLAALTRAAQMCPLKPVELPPVSATPMIQACTCDSVGMNCRWVWVQADSGNRQNQSAGQGDGAAIINSLSGGGLQVPDWNKIELQRQQAENLRLQTDF